MSQDLVSPRTPVLVTALLATALSLTAHGCRPERSPPETVRIHHVQGRGHLSPLAGQEVAGVSGVVTAVDAGGDEPGFWIEDPEGDGDDATSEGLFVATATGAVRVAVGQAVAVDGVVEEAADPKREHDLTVTRLRAAGVRQLPGRRALPPPVRLGEGGRRPPPAVIDDDTLKKFQPESDGIDFWESLEGMRVEVAGAVVVGPTTINEEIVVAGDGAALRTRRGGLVLRAGDDNPERLMIGSRLLGKAPQVDVGDRFDGIVAGVLDYHYGNFKIVPAALPPVVPAAPVDEATRLRGTEKRLTLATFNVLNFSPREAPEKLRRLAAVIARDLAAPDLVALQEMQDDNGAVDDGVTGAAATFQALVAAVAAAGGPRYDFRQIDPLDHADGGRPGGNIRVGLLFNPARLAFVDRGAAGPLDATRVESGADGVRLSLSPARVAPGDPAFAGSRKPLAGELVFVGRKLFVIVTHLSSKRGDDPLFGARQPPQYRTEEKRSRQVRAVRELMESLLAADPEARVVVLGDMNELEFRPPLRALKGSRWVNLIERVPEDDRYTFIYQGNSQVLDHVLVSPALAAGAAPEIDVVHVNADLAYGRAASDHDPVVVRLTFE